MQSRLAEGRLRSAALGAAAPASVTSPPPPAHAGLLQADGEHEVRVCGLKLESRTEAVGLPKSRA